MCKREETKVIFSGIDAGSRAIKIVLYDSESDKIIASVIKDQGIEQERLAKEAFSETLQQAGISKRNIAHIIATGYGRNIIPFADSTVTEITCHAKGVHYLHPEVRTIIDIGGQDSKLIKLDDTGNVHDFAMNDRCAAGTGRFLEIVAERLKVPLIDIGLFARKSVKPKMISSMCVVFAETEIIGLLATGAPTEDIAAGVIKSIASRIVSMGGRLIKPPIAFTGGVALIRGVKDFIDDALGEETIVPSIPQLTGALGAAIASSKKSNKVKIL